MPELPEVETVKNYLLKSPSITNKKITAITIPSSRLLHILKGTTLEKLKNNLLYNSIINIQRRGKYLLFYCKKQTSFIIHLGMSGKIIKKENENKIIQNQKTFNPKTKAEVFNAKNTSTKHLYFYLKLTGGIELFFYDPRTFGKIYLLPHPNPSLHPVFKKLGKEPLTTPLNILYGLWPFTSEKKIKPFLIEQSLIAGIGNIYADETLFASGINPLRKTKSIQLAEWKRLIICLRKILRKAITQQGSTIKTYKNPKNERGNYQENLMVYGKEGENCQNCHTTLHALKLQGRTTVYCPNCQKKN